MTNIDSDKHSVQRKFLRKLQVEEVTTEFGVHLLQNISSNGEIHLSDSSCGEYLGDDVLLVADVLVLLVLSLLWDQK